jgi:hypothetical protein
LLAAFFRSQEEIRVADFAFVERLVLFAVGDLWVRWGLRESYLDFYALFDGVVHEETVAGVSAVG